MSALAGVLCPPRWACLPICLPSGFVFHLGWGAVSASLGLSPNLSPIWLCLSPWLGCSLGLSPNLSPTWLCLSPWLGCCVRLVGLVSQFVSHLALSFSLAGVLCPPRWACLRSCLPICLPSGFVFHWGAVSASLGLSPNLSPIWLCLSPWLGCCVRLAGLVSKFVSQCSLPICFPSGFVFHLGWGAASASLGLSPVLSPNLSPIWRWGAVSASLGLSPNLSPIWLCLSPWLGCCVRLAGLVSKFVSQCSLPICFPSGFVFHLGLSPVLSPNLSPIWLCLSPWLGCCVRLAGLVSKFVAQCSLPICFPSGFVFHLVSQFVSHLALSFTLAGVLCPRRWACLLIPQAVYGWGSQCFLSVSALTGLVFLLSAVLSPVLSAILAGMLCPPRWAVSGLVSQLVSHLVWGALSASLVLSFSCLWSCLPAFVFVLSRSLSFIWDAVSAPLGLSFSCLWSCLPACLGCCVRLLGSSRSPACLRSFVPSCFPAGLVCPCSGLVSKISCAICATVWGLRWCNFFFRRMLTPYIVEFTSLGLHCNRTINEIWPQ